MYHLVRNDKVRFMIYQDTMNQQRLIQFMERLIRVSKQKVFLILDSLKVHRGKFAASWLKRHKDKIEVFFRVNPKFCVNSIWGANRAKFIQGGSRGIRLLPC